MYNTRVTYIYLHAHIHMHMQAIKTLIPFFVSFFEFFHSVMLSISFTHYNITQYNHLIADIIRPICNNTYIHTHTHTHTHIHHTYVLIYIYVYPYMCYVYVGSSVQKIIIKLNFLFFFHWNSNDIVHQYGFVCWLAITLYGNNE